MHQRAASHDDVVPAPVIYSPAMGAGEEGRRGDRAGAIGSFRRQLCRGGARAAALDRAPPIE